MRHIEQLAADYIRQRRLTWAANRLMSGSNE